MPLSSFLCKMNPNGSGNRDCRLDVWFNTDSFLFNFHNDEKNPTERTTNLNYKDP
jgi:hypothetical protein